MTHTYADPYAVRCPTCCAPPLPERDGRTTGFAHASWCRHAPRPERTSVPMLTQPPTDENDDALTLDHPTLATLGDVVDFVIEYTLGSSDTTSGSLGISLPVVGPVFPSPIGVAGLRDADGSFHPGIVRSTAGGDELRVHVSTDGTIVTPSSPFTWGTGDQIYVSGRYRVP